MSHTPGPWRRDCMEIIGSDGSLVVRTHSDRHLEPYGDEQYWEDDARLIVASPVLLAACKAIDESAAPYRADDASPERAYIISRAAMARIRAAINLAKPPSNVAAEKPN